MTDYNSMEREPENNSLINRVNGILYSSSNRRKSFGTLSLLAGLGSLGIAILSDDKTVSTLNYIAGSAWLSSGLGLFYLNYRIKSKKI
ncbi:MAG: hypothetical protein U9Q06_03090 [Nanoarchaeota archaeon]|nr:hypothetical protein [Nanoarchaeota archaeon]